MPVNTHPFSQEDVMAYLDGELTPELAAEMTAHLAQCRACQDWAADLQGVSRHLAGWTVESAGSGGELPKDLAVELAVRAIKTTRTNNPLWHWPLFAQRRRTTIAVALFAATILLTLPFVRSWWRTVQYEKLQSDFSRVRALNRRAVRASEGLSEQIAPAKAPGERYSRVEAKKDSAPTLIARTAELQLTAAHFETVRDDLEHILAKFAGHIGQLQVSTPSGEGRSLSATLRIPSPQLDAALGEIRKLGRVDSESQQGEEVTQQSIDLDARLENAGRTEQTLQKILATRAGKLSDVLEVEQELAKIRGEIERAEAEKKNLSNRVSFATVTLRIGEDYRAPLTNTAQPSLGSRLQNSAVDGLHTAFNGIIGIVQFFLAAGPSVLLIALVFGLPAYFFWKKHRR